MRTAVVERQRGLILLKRTAFGSLQRALPKDGVNPGFH
jgi:hypothetical protein